MIPKIIHYCWFGGNPLPELARKCIESWYRHCPDYRFIEWNENNFDITSCPVYVQQAYKAKKWAFVTDYVRLRVVYENGGIYMDTDVELKKGLSHLLGYDAYFGFEDGMHIATGLGFGAIKSHPILKEMMDDYENVEFLTNNGELNTETCPVRNTRIIMRHGLKQNDKAQILDGNVLVLPSIYFCPLSYETGIRRWSLKTISIHWFDASWRTEQERLYHEKRKRKNRIEYFSHLPSILLHRILGDTGYQKLKSMVKRGK